MALPAWRSTCFSLLDAPPVRCVLYRYRRWNMDPRGLISCAGWVSLRCIDTCFIFLFYFYFFACTHRRATTRNLETISEHSQYTCRVCRA